MGQTLFADTIFTDATVLTMDDAAPEAEAIAVRAGLITAVGKREDVLKQAGPNTKVISLGGATLTPGFIDGHSHLGSYMGIWGSPDLSPPPVGTIATIPELIEKLRAAMKQRSSPPGSLIFGFGYDDAQLAEKRHPTADELDAISTQHPVIAIHASGHLAVANHYALEAVGFTRDAPDPKGGVIARDKDGNPTGLVKEEAVFALAALAPRPSLDEAIATLGEVQSYYASQGITTAQEGLTSPVTLALLREANARGKLKIDVVAFPRWTQYRALLEKHDASRALKHDDHPELPGHSCDAHEPETSSTELEAAIRAQLGHYSGRLKFGGIKITTDGSPQGRTAYLTKPYYTQAPGQPVDYRGVRVIEPEELDRWFDAAYAYGVQLIVHCNGDAAADMMISAVRKAQRAHGKLDLRPVMIHAQTVRDDQLDAMKELGIFPSFFVAHTFFWGDWHASTTLGPERAARISPLASARKREMIFSNHTDAPVIPVNQMSTVFAAVNRVTRSGKVLGPEERISPLDALKALTIWPAYQYFEQDSKGSITVGKRADLTVLSDNPLTIAPQALRDVKVLRTIKDGETIFEAPPTARPSRARNQPRPSGEQRALVNRYERGPLASPRHERASLSAGSSLRISCSR